MHTYTHYAKMHSYTWSIPTIRGCGHKRASRIAFDELSFLPVGHQLVRFS